MQPSAGFTRNASNILGATGLPRAVLAQYFRVNGLFGRDSSLSAQEQAAACRALPRGMGLPVSQQDLPLAPRLAAVTELATALLYGEDPADAVLAAAGLSGHARAELDRTVANVRLLFEVPARAVSPRTAGEPTALPRAA